MNNANTQPNVCWNPEAQLLQVSLNGRLWPLRVASAVDQPGRLECDAAMELFARESTEQGERLVFRASRSIWQRSELEVLVTGKEVLFCVRVEGSGQIEAVRFFHRPGRVSYTEPSATVHRIRVNPEAENRFIAGSPFSFTHVFSPQPDHWNLPTQPSTIDRRLTCATTFGPDIFNTFFAPCVYCYVLDKSCSVGIVAEEGQRRFNHFDYLAADGWGLLMNYDGMTSVSGVWQSPWIRMAVADGDFDGVADYLRFLQEIGVTPQPDPSAAPEWSRKPVFCGWGQQVAWGNLASSRACPEGSPITPGAMENCTQPLYEEMVRLLDERELPYGTLIIDAGWSLAQSVPMANPAFWPDLKGFIKQQHERGKKVLLWLAMWFTKGAQDEWLMDSDGKVTARIDPTKESFRQALTEAITTCISPDGLDADGFKLDFSGDLPRGRGYRPARDLWGMELTLDYLRLIHTTMKSAKTDSVLETHCACPEAVDCCEMLRLNDIFYGKEDVREMMRFRSQIARLVNPHWPIDTDNSPFASKSAWMDYLQMQPEIGVPSLYTITHMEFPDASGVQEEVTPEDWQRIRECWCDCE